MTEDYPELAIRVLMAPRHPTREALVNAYREGLKESADQGWRDAFALARLRFPHVDDGALGRMLLLTLGLFDSDALERMRAGEPPDPDARMPILLGPHVRLRVGAAAAAFGITVDELVTRIVSAWCSAACDRDGQPIGAAALPEGDEKGD